MRFSLAAIVYALTLAATTDAKRRKKPDIKVRWTCVGTINRQEHDKALAELKDWCDRGNKMYDRGVSFNGGHAFSFMCSRHGYPQICNSIEIHNIMWDNGIMEECVKDGHGWNAEDVHAGKTFGVFNTNYDYMRSPLCDDQKFLTDEH